jgi:hypothetical protein
MCPKTSRPLYYQAESGGRERREGWNEKCVSGFRSYFLQEVDDGEELTTFKQAARKTLAWAQITTVQSLLLLGLSGGLSSCVLYGQVSVLQNFNPLSSKTGGLRLYGASVSSSYSSGAYGSGIIGVLPGATDASFSTLQGSASFGWSRQGQKSAVSLGYSPSYVRGLRSFNYDSLNHSLAFSANRLLSSKWTVGSSVTGILTDFSQLLFSPTKYASVTATQSTFDELVAAMLTGRSSNVTLTQVVGAAPVVGSPEAAFPYGNRILSASASFSLSYAGSSRSSITMSLGVNRTQAIDAAESAPAIDPTRSLARTSNGNASLNWSYSLTPRTTLGANLSSSRTFSSFQDSYNTQSSISIGRTISRRWFAQGMAGAGFITPIRSAFSPSRNVQPVFGGGVGFKVYAQSFLVSYSRSTSDVYGLGANSTESSGAGWTWQRPGRSVSVNGGFGYQRLISPAFSNQGSWTGNAGVAKSFAASVSLSAAFSYSQYPGSVFSQAVGRSQTGVIVTLGWSPSSGQ